MIRINLVCKASFEINSKLSAALYSEKKDVKFVKQSYQKCYNFEQAQHIKRSLKLRS